MTNAIISAPERPLFIRNSKKRTRFRTHFVLLAVAAALTLCIRPAEAVNVLVNPGFETGKSGHVIPFGWTRFAPPTAQAYGNYYVQALVPPHSGSAYYKEWGACYNGTNNVAGIYQDLSSTPGSIYQASGWFYDSSTLNNGNEVMGADCHIWMEVSFLGASSNVLALYKSADYSSGVGTDEWFQYQVTNACNLAAPVSVGDPFFT